MASAIIEKLKAADQPPKRKKKFDAKKFFGLIKWGEDGVKYQRKLRDGK